MAVDKTFVNGGSLLPSDLNKIQEDYEGGYLFQKHLISESTRLDAPSAGTFLLGSGTSGAGVAASGATAALSAFYLNPAADYEQSAVNKRTVKLMVRATAIVNAVAPTVNYTVGLYPVSAAAGAENVTSITLGTVVAGSTALFTAPAKETLTQVASSEFAAPATGFYALACVVSGSAAAKSSVALRATLLMKQE